MTAHTEGLRCCILYFKEGSTKDIEGQIFNQKEDFEGSKYVGVLRLLHPKVNWSFECTS